MRTPLMTVGDLAHEAVSTTLPTSTLREAAAELAGENRGVLLVTGVDVLAGIVSERDVVRAIGEGEDPDELRVEDVMTEHVVTIAATATVDEAIALMDADQIRHLVVVRGSTPIGIISLRDLARALLVAPSRV